jgi:hypothetical protein
MSTIHDVTGRQLVSSIYVVLRYLWSCLINRLAKVGNFGEQNGLRVLLPLLLRRIGRFLLPVELAEGKVAILGGNGQAGPRPRRQMVRNRKQLL